MANNFQRSSGLLMDAIVSSKVVSGNADFFSVSGQDLTLLADATDPFVFNIGGDTFVLQANKTLTATNNAHNFIYIDPTKTLGRSATPPTYAYTAPGAPASGDFWYDLGKMQMKTYNGAAWVASAVVFIGYVRCDAATIDARYVCEPTGLTPHRRWAELGDGSDGFLDVSAGTTTIDGAKQYTAVVVRGGTLTHTSQTQDQLSVLAQGVFAVIGSGAVNLNGKGRAAGAGQVGAGSAGSGAVSGGAGGGGGAGTNAGGAGGGTLAFAAGFSTGGGTAGTAGGGAGGSATLCRFPSSNPHGFAWYAAQGCGGGGGGGDGAAAGGAGGNGGGFILVRASALAVGGSATFSANGANGTAGAAANRGGGGGGGGGVIHVTAGNIFETTSMTVAAGTGGGSGGSGSGAGGDGAAGRIVRCRL